MLKSNKGKENRARTMKSKEVNPVKVKGQNGWKI